MAAKIFKETKSLSVIETTATATATAMTAEAEPVSDVRCDCCGLTEECTSPYIARVCERYQGRWICGLCAEAVKEESLRSQRDLTTDEALKRHMKFCQQFRSSSPPHNPTEDLILAMKQLMFRTLDSPKKERLMSSCRSLGRSQSCFPTISGSTQAETHSESRIVEGREKISEEKGDSERWKPLTIEPSKN